MRHYDRGQHGPQWAQLRQGRRRNNSTYEFSVWRGTLGVPDHRVCMFPGSRYTRLCVSEFATTSVFPTFTLDFLISTHVDIPSRRRSPLTLIILVSATSIYKIHFSSPICECTHNMMLSQITTFPRRTTRPCRYTRCCCRLAELRSYCVCVQCSNGEITKRCIMFKLQPGILLLNHVLAPWYLKKYIRDISA